MDLDELKDAWKQDKPQDLPLQVSTALHRKTSSAITKVRKNMRNEFIMVTAAYLVLLLFFLFPLKNQTTTPSMTIAGILLSILLLLNCFYFFRFYLFYRSTGRYDYNARESIRKVAYDLELNTEIYKTYNFCVGPLGVLAAIMMVKGKFLSAYIQHITNAPGYLLSMFTILLFSFAITYMCLEWHVHQMYGKYLRELKQVMNDLEKEG